MSRKPRSQVPSERGRFTAKRKTSVVLRLLRGEDLDTVSREIGVTAACLAGWQDDFLKAGESGLRSRKADSRDLELDRVHQLGHCWVAVGDDYRLGAVRHVAGRIDL